MPLTTRAPATMCLTMLVLSVLLAFLMAASASFAALPSSSQTPVTWINIRGQYFYKAKTK